MRMTSETTATVNGRALMQAMWEQELDDARREMGEAKREKAARRRLDCAPRTRRRRRRMAAVVIVTIMLGAALVAVNAIAQGGAL